MEEGPLLSDSNSRPEGMKPSGSRDPESPSQGNGAERSIPAAWSDGIATNSWYLRLRTILEWAGAGLLLVLTAPVVLAAALVIKLTSPGPVFYCQTRMGRHGRPFKLYKIRTMIDHCEANSGPCWSLPGDIRITRVGQLLRQTHVDELPQLLNVLRGQMRLIGPRPERPEFLPMLEQALPNYRWRLLVRPGLTGLAQVQLPADTDVESVRRKLDLDLYYLHHCGPWLDLQILTATVCCLLRIPTSWWRKIIRLPGSEVVEGKPWLAMHKYPGIAVHQSSQ
jgi:lipopolysaccharide/colanic/teichoic acid biosynthesis glycosyltransferase